QRGEDTWMLPEVDLRLQQLEQEVSGKKKKEKKAKKIKKKKRKKEKKRAEGGDGSSSEVSVIGLAYLCIAPPPFLSPLDEWMTFDFLTMRTTSTAEKRAEKERLKEEEKQKAWVIEQAGLHKLELNPFWKDGGSGLPPEEKASNVLVKAATVDDGGLGWLRKSYQRMREQAEREQRSLEVIVAERYGSMENFQKRMYEAEIAVYGEGEGRGRGEGEGRGRGKGEGRGRGEEEGRDRQRWRRGQEDGMWRKGEVGMDRERWRRPDKGRDLPGEKERDGERDSERDGERERARHRDRDRDRNRARDGDSERDGGRPSDRDRERDGGRPSDQERERAGGRERDGSRPSDRNRERAGGRERDRGRERGGDESLCSGLGQIHPPLSLGALKSRFLKPAADDDDGELSVVPRSVCGVCVSDSSSDSLSEEEEEVPILTDEEMNKLGARLVKAEIMGNTALMEKLKTQLESARNAKENRAAQQPGKSDRVSGGEVLLFRTDQSGRAWPVNASSEPQEPRGRRRKKKAIETHRDGERMRYFQDDDSVGLHEMVRREKMSSAEDQNSLYARMAGKMMGKTDDDNYTLDDMFVSSVAQREGEGRDEERMRSRAIAEHRRLAVTMEKCHHCFSNPELQKHLLIAIGTKVYLSLPGGVSLTEGHCLITPLQHHCSATGLDEDVWTEIQVFRRALVQMFESQDQDCVFMETHMNPKRRQHMVLECIPLPRELGDMAPIYFKKAIMECDEEWAMNKKVVDLSSKDIRHAVPRGLPYFSVDFGLQGGFAHVIENEHKFPHYFGKEIVGGMLDVEPRIWRKSIRENFDDQRKKVLEFSQWWKPFDCTKTDS
uniref:CWF19-like protein 2 n=1 Tax=Oncorhynchus tshawytscha TaxID=74940 RepID=A0A8C8IJK1_ONCTS